MSAVQKKYSGTNVNYTFYLMQYLVYQHEVIIKEYLLMFYILFFCTAHWKTRAWHHFETLQKYMQYVYLRLAAFQVLDRRMWLLPIVLDSTALG